MLVECRLPAYDRPELLHRALLSLQAQSHRDWVAVVLDDSRTQSGRAVVNALGDARIHYRHNLRQRGSTGNLNQAFDPAPLFGGEFAFILEDDNALTPDFIAAALRHAVAASCTVLSMNQRSVKLDGQGRFIPSTDALRPENTDVVWSHERVILNSLNHMSLPNGGYFWRCNTVDLRVDERITEPMLQESARHLRIPGDLLLAKEACSLWSALPDDLLRRNRVSNRVFRVTRDLLALGVMRLIPGSRLLEWGRKELCPKDLAYLESRVAGVCWTHPSQWYWLWRKPKEAAKGLMLRLLYGRKTEKSLRTLLLDEPEKLFA
jgi:glycosyltransferase involved in cell wall biosynthesis